MARGHFIVFRVVLPHLILPLHDMVSHTCRKCVCHKMLDFVCDCCGVSIVGARYCCLQCCDVDLCSECHEAGDAVEVIDRHSSDHPVMSVRLRARTIISGNSCGRSPLPLRACECANHSLMF